MNELEIAYRDFERLSLKHEPMAAAGVMMAQALKIYKTVLSQDEFENITTYILDTRDSIQPIDRPTLN